MLQNGDLFLRILKNGPIKDFKKEYEIFVNHIKEYVREQHLTYSHTLITTPLLNSGITNEKVRIEIAKIAAEEDGCGTSRHIQNYEITDQEALIEIAKIAAANNGCGVSEYIQAFGIKEEKGRIEIAKIAAAKDGYGTSRYIQNYEITDQEALIEIAKIAAANNGCGVSGYIQVFGIKEEKGRIEIAKVAAAENGWRTSEQIQRYGIKSEAARIEIAKISAKQNGERTSEWIQRYGIISNTARIEIAKIAAGQDGRGTSECVWKYGITEEKARLEIAKIAAAQIIFSDLSIKMLIKKLKYLFRKPNLAKLLIKKAPLIDFREYFDRNRSHKPCCEWGYRMINALPDDLSDVSLQQRIRFITATVLSMEGNGVSHQEITNLNNQETLNQALIELPDPKLQRSLFQYLADLPKKEAMELFCTWINSESLSENPRKVKSIQILAVLILAGHCEQVTILTLLRKINRNFIRFQNRNLLLNTLDLMVKSPLGRDQADQILKGLFSFKDSKSILHALHAVRGIFSFGEASDLTAVGHLNFNNEMSALKEIRSLFSKAFIKGVHLEDKEIENFYEKYEKTFGKFRDPEAIKKYAASLAQLSPKERQSTLSLLGEYVVHVLEGSFKEWRFENSSHLNALWANNEKLQSDWKNLRRQEPLEKFLRSESGEECPQEMPDFQGFILLAFDQNHISKDEYPHVYNYLLFKEQRKQIMADLISVMKLKKIEGTAEEKNELRKQKERVKFQKLVIQLVEGQHNPTSIKSILEKIETYKEIPIDFENDVRGWRNGLENSLKEKKPSRYRDWTCGFSDDADDLLLCGTDVDGSCQKIDGNPNLNKCLLAYMCDGKNQLVVIKDHSGKIQARGIVRILVGKDGEPVLFLERFYPAILAEELQEALVRMAVETAKGLGLALLSIQINPKYLKEAYQGDICSNGSIAHFEYEDVSKGICEGGKFIIAGSRYVDLFVYS